MINGPLFHCICVLASIFSDKMFILSLFYFWLVINFLLIVFCRWLYYFKDIHIYIHIYRERVIERQRQRKRKIHIHFMHHLVCILKHFNLLAQLDAWGLSRNYIQYQQKCNLPRIMVASNKCIHQWHILKNMLDHTNKSNNAIREFLLL